MHPWVRTRSAQMRCSGLAGRGAARGRRGSAGDWLTRDPHVPLLGSSPRETDACVCMKSDGQILQWPHL